MDNESKVIFAVLVGIMISLCLCVSMFTFTVDYLECRAKTANIGFSHSWGPMSGCLLEVKPGQWIPLESYYFKQE